ncbi:MAG: hypothetical protein EAX95_14185, partial [Candidatus Thorarchaeota archaeon]|nr:hypothetical protein [Candidatus Thorarchaeota archaeon]
NTTKYAEGEHKFTFKAVAPNGYFFKWSIILEVDNHGVPDVRFLSPKDDMVTGVASFTIEIVSTWDQVNITVYVDDEIVPSLNETLVNVGEYTFTIDTNAYSKWQHAIKVLVTTVEGETDEAEREFGFANFKVEEIISIAIILVLAFVYPITRWRRGLPIIPVIIADILFVAVVMSLFLVAGINSWTTMVWHINLASIWAIGVAIIATNWIVPIAIEAESE